MKTLEFVNRGKAVKLIKRGCTPREVERAFSRRNIIYLAEETGVEPMDIWQLAERWGIKEVMPVHLRKIIRGVRA